MLQIKSPSSIEKNPMYPPRGSNLEIAMEEEVMVEIASTETTVKDGMDIVVLAPLA